jgi:hypothetical protein
LSHVLDPPARPRGFARLASLRGRQWSAPERAVVIAVLAIVMGSLFVTTYSLALGDPVPHRIDAALDLTATRPTLYVASAAGASVARVLEGISTVDPTVRVVDTHPLPATDPSGLDIFYLMLVTTIIGFFTVFQVRANAGGLSLRRWTAFVVGLAPAASLALTLVDGQLLRRLELPVLESWGILALQLAAVASFTSLMSVLIGRWAVLPTWLFFVILGNSSSGGAVAPPLLPRPFAFVSQWLPSGATVTALRDAVYFGDYQHARPIAVLAAWAMALFAAMLVVSHRRGASPGVP